LAEKGKLSKTARASTQFSKGEVAAATIENDSSKGKVFTEVKKILSEANIGFQNLSSSHPIIVNKGSLDEAWTAIKPALVDGDNGRYKVEAEEAGQIVLVENVKKDPGKMVIRESPFSWHAAG